jgi:hypothetical protein
VILDGWKEIQTFMRQLSGIERSRYTLWRYSQRQYDPLPIFRTLGGRPRADDEQLAAWWARHRFTY